MILLRYVSFRFLLAFALFWVGLTGLVLLGDFVARIDRILEVKNEPVAPMLASYYAAQIPFSLPLTLPIAVLLASVFTLVQLARANELVPMMVGGVSLRKLSLPFLAAAVAAGILLAWVQQAVLPKSWDKVVSLQQRLSGRAKPAENVSRRTPAGHHITAERYLPRERAFEMLHVVLVDAGGRPHREVESAEGRWDAERGLWILRRGRVFPLEDGRRKTESTDEGGRRMVFEPIPEDGLGIDLDVTPSDMQARSDHDRPMSLADAVERSRRHPGIPFYRIEAYKALTEPLSPLILLLLGLAPAIGAAAGSRNILVGLGLCLPTIVVFFGVKLVAGESGAQGVLPPFLASVVPTLLFAAIGVVLFARIRT